ncbi:hypothetical protein QU487_06200 [Crenobacter sp. SG2305]|uniref:recombination directionality factor n=1 Tax=Crenobacter oryzisoli TaxID=3056844 RepID=UPI0025AA7B09|nr:hypothetical protein [Crenobacter sp. SG2305]MDN0082343.1 hypothetical protein [Crenobacter sp. SG2305]
MLKNIAYLMPLVGRVSMGELVKNDEQSKPRPVKHNYFSITTQAKKKGVWVKHPYEDQLLESPDSDDDDQPQQNEQAVKRLREIPIKVLFDNPDLSLNEGFVAFDDKGRQLCRGDGQQARMLNSQGVVETVSCAGADHCKMAQASRCKLLGRFHFGIDIKDSDPSFNAFALRTSGYNTIRAIRAKLTMFKAAFGGLAGLPLKLVIRGKSSKASYDTPFFYADVDLNCGFWEAAQKVIEFRQKAQEKGVNLAAMEEAYAALSAGLIQETVDDVEEFEEVAAGEFSMGSGWGEPEGQEANQDNRSNQGKASDWKTNLLSLVDVANASQAVVTMGQPL